MKIHLVTSILGEDRDFLIDSIIPESNSNYIAYTDQSSNAWEIKTPCSIFSENKKNAKIHKVLIHKYEECDVSIWMDGNVQILKAPSEIVKDLLGDSDMAVCIHPNRKNIFQEAEHIINVGVEYSDIISKQIARYENDREDIINEQILCFCTVIIRRHTPEVNNFNEQWWAEICTNSFRDQVSFPYILRQHNLKVNRFPYSVFVKYFNRIHHEPITYQEKSS